MRVPKIGFSFRFEASEWVCLCDARTILEYDLKMMSDLLSIRIRFWLCQSNECRFVWEICFGWPRFVCGRLLRIDAMIFNDEMSSQQQIKSIIIY